MLKSPFLQLVLKTRAHELMLQLHFRFNIIVCLLFVNSDPIFTHILDFVYAPVHYKLLLQRVAVLHLEEKCERAIEWALEMEPFMKHLVLFNFAANSSYRYIYFLILVSNLCLLV